MSSDYTAPNISINPDTCTLCAACADMCLGNAIFIREAKDGTEVKFDSQSCIMCENCHDFYYSEECPTGAFLVE